MPNDKEVIFLSKRKSFLILFGAIALVIAGVFLVVNPPQGYNLIFIRLAGIAAVIFFGVGVIIAFQKLLDKKPGLIIDNTGITDTASGISAGHILWENIIEIKTVEIKKQKIIMVIVNNPDEYISRPKNPFSRQMAEMNYKIYGSPIGISANTLKCKHNELENILQEQIKKWGNKNIIEN
jgi:hypothetical protein